MGIKEAGDRMSVGVGQSGLVDHKFYNTDNEMTQCRSNRLCHVHE